MGKLYVVNDLKLESIIVKEGSGSTHPGVKVSPGQQHVVKVDPGATYREILLVLDKRQAKVQAKFSSDDCQECKQIRVYGYNTFELHYRKVEKTSRGASVNIPDGSAWQSFLKFFGMGRNQRNRPAPVTQQAAADPSGGSVPDGKSAADGGNVKLAEASSNGGSAPTGGSAPEGSSAPDSGSTKLAVAAPHGGSVPGSGSTADSGLARPAEASPTNGATETDGAKDQAPVPVI